MYAVIKYIHEHIEERLTLADLAKTFGYSKWYFCELFKRFTGTTVLDYIRSYRIQLAALDVLDGKKAVDVAVQYGYETQSGFNKAFLKEYGCLPREFKHKSYAYHIAYKERRSQMFQLSDRCAILREDAVNSKSWNESIWAQRCVLFQEGLQAATAAGVTGNHRLIASALANVIEKAPALVQEGELIVGYNYADTPFSDGGAPEDTAENRALLGRCGFSAERVERYFATRDQAYAGFTFTPAPTLSRQESELDHEWAALGFCIADNHTVIDYEAVLRYGFEGLLTRVEAAVQRHGPSPLYDGMMLLCRAGCQWGQHYAAAVHVLLDNGSLSDSRRQELQRMECVCRRVPAKPARNFWEAVQSLWFAHIINTWEDGINANSLGRLDQILYPYYQQDIDQGILTKKEAFELICCLWIKLYRDYDVQQSCVGGCLPDGRSAVNDLSYLMLDATEELNFVRCLSVRFSPTTDKAFLKRALEVLGHVQKGVPFFFNDDVMIPALVSKGIRLEDARDYTQIGCVETVIPGKSNPHAVSGKTNLLKALEYVFGNGRSLRHPDMTPGLQTGPLADFDTYEALEQAVMRQVEHLVDSCCKKVALWSKTTEINCVKPYKSLLTEGCIDSGRDFNDHGALYDYYQIMLGGVPNLADSLMVIKQFVYRDHRLTLQEMYEQLVQDFSDEALRQEFLYKAPKFGNDIDEVDDIAAHIIHVSCDELERAEKRYGLQFHAQPFTYLWMIEEGNETAASPDGRHAGEIIAYSVSPMQGRDFHGFTALLNSLSKLPTKRCPGTTSAIVEVDPKLFTDANIDRFVDVLAAAASRGLCNVQFNIIDAETLVDAQQYPEKYANLAVRVSGFSQKFNLLNRELQDHIIGRTKHKCL